jgi:ribonuclease PH
MSRNDGRSLTSLRPISFETGYIAHHPGSVLVSFGGTRVLVTCTAEKRVPSFRLSSGGGWVTADYNMLAASTHERRKKNPQRADGRSMEIQRLIGRALRNVVNLNHLGQRTLNLDCDVIQADGGTRTASITGAYVALKLCLADLAKKPDGIKPSAIEKILTGQVAAVSLGVVDGKICTDLCYEEDSRADTDLNLVARHDGTIIEVQGTAEGAPLTRGELDQLVDQGLVAIEELCLLQRQAVERALQ